MLLRREEHMVKKYGERGHCWSLFLKACIDNGTLSVYQGESDDTRTGLERLKRMIHELVSHLHLPPPLEDSNETRKIAPSVIIVPETPTKVSPASPQHTTVDTSTELHEFKDHVYEEELGQGGFGVVCRMQHKVDKKRYAVKIVRLCDRPDEEQKVMREVEALARLDHPNIVRYYDSWKSRAPPNWQQISPWKQLPSSYSMSYPSGRRTGETESQNAAPDASATLSPYISSNSSESGPTASEAAVVEYSTVDVLHGDAPETEKRKSLNPLRLDPEPPVCLCIKTELCERETLKAWLRAHKEDRKRKEVTAWFVEILKGVMYIHCEGLIHRDLKPSNIFFSLSGRKIKIGDFGLVTTSQVDLGEAASHKSNYVGTSYYISPEQNKKENYGREVDIYALGITFFEMNYPFITDMEKDKVLTALRNDGIFPKHFKDHLYHEANIIKWMLTVDPQKRPSAEEVFSSETMKRLQRSSNKSKATIPLL
ncbi:eIF-2-alpha kinase GCN2 [Geodia barretti]|nr:eIF-2-alpha kinase GCN2 [Geodia barretti]